MKRVVLLLVLTVMCILTIAQTPESFNYQVVVRDGVSNNPLVNQNVTFKMSILKGNSSGISQYSELHSANTGDLGIVNLVIGNGTDKAGTISAIDWGADTYYLKVEIDKTGGSTYVEMGTTQLLSVPYALHAKTVASYTETDPVYISKFDVADAANGDLLQFNGTKFGKFTPNYLTSEVDGSVTNEIQNLSSVLTQSNSAGNTNIIDLADPVNNQDAATKAYVDAILSQLSAKGAIVADADGNIYSTVRIGSQVWMGENLKTTKYRNGDLIGTTTPATLDISGDPSPKYQWAYDGNESNVDTYGRLYTWYTVTDSRNICPSSWHLPSDLEWTTLENYLIANGFNYDETTTGNKYAKVLASVSGWTSSATAGAVGNTDYPVKRNATGFTALPGGMRTIVGPFQSVGNFSYWWSATEFDASNALIRYLYYNNSDFMKSVSLKKRSYSIRCVRD